MQNHQLSEFLPALSSPQIDVVKRILNVVNVYTERQNIKNFPAETDKIMIRMVFYQGSAAKDPS